MKKYIACLLMLFCSTPMWSQEDDESDLTAPVVQATAYQHEIELSWEDDESEGISWEVIINEDRKIKVTDKRCVIDMLDADTEYSITVNAVKGEEKAEGEELKVYTKKLQKKKDDLSRIPYLRTVSLDGTCPRILPLYYNELANIGAKITYKLNGQIVTPKDNKLEINSNSYRDRLEIKIDEGDGRVWNIIYYLAVKR